MKKIIEMAREAGFSEWAVKTPRDLERFAELVRADEREACWNIIFEYAGRDDITPEDESLLKHLADLIRARGQA